MAGTSAGLLGLCPNQPTSLAYAARKVIGQIIITFSKNSSGTNFTINIHINCPSDFMKNLLGASFHDSREGVRRKEASNKTPLLNMVHNICCALHFIRTGSSKGIV